MRQVHIDAKPDHLLRLARQADPQGTVAGIWVVPGSPQRKRHLTSAGDKALSASTMPSGPILN
jgi:hypothetical protein